ncbi:MAG TPA: hypothetical protein VM326_02430, partial [Sphingomicrobium sp.]|nr:hypothetical protein [Sphingomicrobium sp.]
MAGAEGALALAAAGGGLADGPGLAAAQGLAPARSTLAEMEKFLSLEERQRGVAKALELAKAPAAKPGP